MEWWIWVIVGVALLVGELLTPGGFYLLFVGTAAIFVGTAIGLGMPYDLWYQVFLFAALSLLFVSLARRPLMKKLKLTAEDRAAVHDVVNETATANSAIGPGETGRAELRGTLWNARNSSHATIEKGQRCRVASVDGLTLVVVSDGTQQGGKS